MARGRKERVAQAPGGPGTNACPLCGEVVPVGEDGRCDLGHRVRQPGAANTATEPLSHVDVIEHGVDVADVAGLAAAGLAIAGTVPLEETALAETARLEPLDAERFEDDEAERLEDDEPVDIAPVDIAPVESDEADDVDLSGELDW